MSSSQSLVMEKDGQVIQPSRHSQ